MAHNEPSGVFAGFLELEESESKRESRGRIISSLLDAWSERCSFQVRLQPYLEVWIQDKRNQPSVEVVAVNVPQSRAERLGKRDS